MKQLTVYDAIRTSSRDVVRWQVREALEVAMKLLTRSGGPDGWTPQHRGARALRAKMMQREYKRRSDRRRRAFDAELETLKQNVRFAVLALLKSQDKDWKEAGNPLRVIKGGKR